MGSDRLAMAVHGPGRPVSSELVPSRARAGMKPPDRCPADRRLAPKRVVCRFTSTKCIEAAAADDVTPSTDDVTPGDDR